MEPERWQRIREVFDAAVERPASERVAYVRATCGGDERLTQDVLELLATHESDPDFLEESVAARAGNPRDDSGAGAVTDSDPMIGRRVGVWRIGPRLGEGGMGVVYRAERDDGAFEQSVAIKVVRRGLDTEHLLQRFASERRILAALDHPDIARPVDAGVLEDGRPFLAMEYVEGECIDTYCARRDCDLEARIDLFLAVCEAVDHAHRRLVIHRDIKPANILVTPEGRVKLLDFGVAKLLDPDDPLAASTLTTADLRPLTPDYASPEQLRGDPVTTAADVYGLGVLLFELVTGQRPFRRGARAERLRTDPIDAPRPSAVTTVVPARLLQGDLDAIVLTAMHPELRDRYDSPRALADDLRRHREGLPVRAREDNTLYRMRRFVRRHRFGATVSASFVLLLAISAFLLLRQVDRTGKERARAERERVAAERVVQWLVDVFAQADPAVNPGGEDLPVSSFLDKATSDIDALSDQPEVQIRAWLALSRIHFGRSRYDQADSVLTRAAERLDALDDDTELRVHVGSMQGKLAAQLGRNEDARRAFEGTLEILRRTVGPDHADYVITLLDLAIVTEDPARRRERLERCLAICESNPAELWATQASVLNALANDHYRSDSLVTAREYYERAEQILARSLDHDHPHLMTVRHNLAAVRNRTGDPVGAETMFRQVLETATRVVGPRTANVAGALGGLGVSLATQRRYAEAQSEFEAAARLFEEVLGDAHPRTALEWLNVARIHELQEDWPGALVAHARAHATIVRARGEESADAGRHLAAMIPSLLATGEVERARSTAERALALVSTDPDDDRDAVAAASLALARTRVGPAEAARRGELLERCHAERSARLPAEDPRVAEAGCALAVHLESVGDADRARSLLQQLLPQLEDWALALPGDVTTAREAARRLGLGSR